VQIDTIVQRLPADGLGFDFGQLAPKVSLNGLKGLDGGG
jgi:hypothetical protein